MKFALPRRAPFGLRPSLVQVAVIGLTTGFCAAPALAADDKSTATALMELVGVSSDADVAAIDYSERPKLVLPPGHSQLPEPQERASRPGWPAEIATERRRNAERYARVPGAEPEKKVGLMERIRGPRPTAAPGTDDEPGFLERALLQRGRASSEPVWEEPSRRALYEPPSGYRRPTQDLSRVRDTDAKKTSWWNPLSYVGGAGSDSDPVAQPGARTPAQDRPTTRGGGMLSSLLPGF